MTIAFLNRCKFVPVAYSNTVDFTVNGSAPVDGAYAPADCLAPVVVDGATYHYFAESSNKQQHEEGDAVWDNTNGKLLRQSGTVRNSSNAGALVNFPAAPTVTMGGPVASDVALRGYENITTANATPKTAGANVLITYVTTDGSGLQQEVVLPSLSNAEVGTQHIVYLKTQTHLSDVVILDVTPATFLLSNLNDFALLEYNGGSWAVISGSGLFAAPATSFPYLLGTGIGGSTSVLLPKDYTDWYFRTFSIVVVAGSGSGDDNFFIQYIESDGSGTPAQTVDISISNAPEKMGRCYLFRLTTQVNLSDTVVITSSIGIVGSEVITLPSSNAWALFMVTADGLLPVTFGGGATTSAVGNRVLTLANTGGLSWV